MHGGSSTLRGGKKKGAATSTGGKKKKRGTKKEAQRAAFHRDAKYRLELAYEERTAMMESGRRHEEKSFKEFEESMEHRKTSHKTLRKGLKAEQAYKKKIEAYKVPLHGGLKPYKKADGIVRLMSININCLSMWKRYNYKAERLRWALQRYKVDSLGLQEVVVNWDNFTTSNLLASMLRQGSDPIRSVISFNTLETKNIGDTQRGGTATIVNDVLTLYVKDTGTDHTHLGRRSWFRLEGEPGHSTRVVTAYAPCGSNSSGVSTYFKQAKRYTQNINLNTNPKKMFREDLYAVLQQWRKRGIGLYS